MKFSTAVVAALGRRAARNGDPAAAGPSLQRATM